MVDGRLGNFLPFSSLLVVVVAVFVWRHSMALRTQQAVSQEALIRGKHRNKAPKWDSQLASTPCSHPSRRLRRDALPVTKSQAA